MNNERPSVLILLDHYLPGFLMGGPVRSVHNVTEDLGDEFEFSLICLDHDLGGADRYADVAPRCWNSVGKSRVMYVSGGVAGLFRLVRQLAVFRGDLVYLNSVFSPRFSMLPMVLRRLRLGYRGGVVLAPRGEFSVGAMAIRERKKRAYLRVARPLGLFDDVTWHATSNDESLDIVREMGPGVQVATASNIARMVDPDEGRSSEPTVAGPERTDIGLRVGFVSRVVPKKNLAFALQVLGKLDDIRISFAIAGPIEDAGYWRSCRALIDRLPGNIEVNVVGAMEPARVGSFLRDLDVLFLPTLGENFGHVIAESLRVGTPVLISDRTPWSNLEDRRFGHDLPLDDPEPYVTALRNHAGTPPTERASRREAIVERCRSGDTSAGDVKDHVRMFRAAIEGPSRDEP